MKWRSSLPSATVFCSALKKDAHLVYVNGIVQGRRASLSILTALEIDEDLHVLGCDGSWRVGVRLEKRKIRSTIFRTKLPRRKCQVRKSQPDRWQEDYGERNR